jgi:hypothetical protein
MIVRSATAEPLGHHSDAALEDATFLSTSTATLSFKKQTSAIARTAMA